MKLGVGLRSRFELNFPCMDYALWAQNAFEFLWVGTVVPSQVFLFSAVLELGDTTDTCVCIHTWLAQFVPGPSRGTRGANLDRLASTTVSPTYSTCIISVLSSGRVST